MRAKLATLGMSMVVVVALVIEGLAIPYFNQNTNQSGTTTTRRRPARRSASKPATTTGDATAEQTTAPATQTMGSTRARRGGRRRGGRRMMMAGVPSGVENCLNHLAQMAASDPLIEYEGHPSQIINEGLLWNDPKSKCAASDPAQRTKIFELGTAWRMKDSAKVRSLLSELGATGTGGGQMTTDTGGTPTTSAPRRRGRRGSRRTDTTTTTPTTTPATTPEATPETQATPPAAEANENSNRGTRRGRRGGRRGRTNSNTANTNSSF
jgi:hypothetical protein